MIEINVVEHVAMLARLALTDEEKQVYARQLSDILDHVHKLQDLDTQGIAPTYHVLPVNNVFREDKVGEHLAPEQTLANAPDKQEEFFKVPKIV